MNNRMLPIDAKLTWIYRVYALYRGFAVIESYASHLTRCNKKSYQDR